MFKSTLFFILTLCPAIALAGDIALSDGTVYKNATIVKHDAANATVLYDEGGATVPISKLPPALQASLGYNPKDAAAQMQADSDYAAYMKALKKYVAIDGKLVLKTQAGVETMNVKLMRVDTATTAFGQDLGRGSYAECYEEAFSHEEIVESDSYSSVGLFVGGAPRAPRPPVSLGLRPDGVTVFLRGTVLSDNAIHQIEAAKVGVTDNGEPYFAPVQPLTEALWQKCGRPQ